MIAIIDASNLYYCIGKKFPGRKLDYAKYKEFLESKGAQIFVAYVPEGPEGFIEYLKSVGWEVRTKKPRRTKVFGKVIYKTDWNVEITKTIMESLIKYGSSNIFLGSSNLDFLPLVKDFGINIVACRIPEAFKSETQYYEEIDESLLAPETT